MPSVKPKQEGAGKGGDDDENSQFPITEKSAGKCSGVPRRASADEIRTFSSKYPIVAKTWEPGKEWHPKRYEADRLLESSSLRRIC